MHCKTAKILALESCLSIRVKSAWLRNAASVPRMVDAAVRCSAVLLDRIEAWLAAVSAKCLAWRKALEALLLLLIELSLLPVLGLPWSARSSTGSGVLGFNGLSKSRITPSRPVEVAASCSARQSSSRILTAPFMVTCEFHCTKSLAAFRYCIKSARQPMICRLRSSGATSKTSRSAKMPPASRNRISFLRVPTIALQTQSTTQSV
mmetsp:Transcript_127666/g.367404  ORF Transcript_127666/g.367404 Transcript_127666/m.367404 type:complete len:206 (+) Transcript_127666:467-1084(+)